MTRPIEDLTERRYGRLTVLRMSGRRDRHNQIMWDCLCDCGNEIPVRGSALKNGNTRSCGCYKKEVVAQNFKGAGLTQE